MIRTEREYRITKAHIAEFERALAELSEKAAPGVHPKIAQAQRDALVSQLQDLRAELADYDALRSGREPVIEIASLAELPIALIRARIASGLTQRELAERLGLPEQQVQRYESTEYESASLARIKKIAKALGLHVREELFLPQVTVTTDALARRLKSVGLDREFVLGRIVPPSLQDEEGGSAVAALRGASRAARIFGWTPSAVLASKAPLEPPTTIGAQLKLPAKALVRRVAVLAAYARHVALLVCEATPGMNVRPVPHDTHAMLAALSRRSSTRNLNSVLEVLWEYGIPVVPLRDAGGFHGACWRVQGRNIIVLKQQTRSEERWVFDLLHEAYHAGQDLETKDFALIDAEEAVQGRIDDPVELAASAFAGDVQLGGRADEIAQLCVKEARGTVERLKAVVPGVAARTGVSTGALANYLAFRLARENKISWWGAANNLQAKGAEPFDTAREFLLRRIDLAKISSDDREFLVRALAWE